MLRLHSKPVHIPVPIQAHSTVTPQVWELDPNPPKTHKGHPITNIPTKTPKSSNQLKKPYTYQCTPSFRTNPLSPKNKCTNKNRSHKANNQNRQRGPTLLCVHPTSTQIPQCPKTINSAAQPYSSLSTPHFSDSPPIQPKPDQKHPNQNFFHMADEHPKSTNR